MILFCVHFHMCLIQKRQCGKQVILFKRITLLFFITKNTDMLLHVRAFYFDYLKCENHDGSKHVLKLQFLKKGMD